MGKNLKQPWYSSKTFYLTLGTIIIISLVSICLPKTKAVNFNIVSPTESSTVNPGEAVTVIVYAWGSVAGIQSISCQGEGDVTETHSFPIFPPTISTTEYFTYNVPWSVTPGQTLTITVTLIDYVDGVFNKYRHVIVAGGGTPTPTPTPTPEGYQIIELVSPNKEEWGCFGSYVSGIPDVNGDGRGDVVVGAYWENPGYNEDAGRAYIFEGDTGNVLQTLVSPNVIAYGYFGWCVAGLADANGDGRGDVAVTAIYESLPGSPSYAGVVYMFSGATGALLHSLKSPNEEEVGNFGWSIAAVPDVDGDGRGDLIVGAPAEDISHPPYYRMDGGRAYVFSGQTGNVITTLESPDRSMNLEFFGITVSGVPDIDGDGQGEVVVGSPYESADFYDAGKAYVFDADTSAILHTLVSPNQQEFGYFGSAVAGVPDIDGDGYGDIIVGAYEEDPPRVYVFSGNSGNLCYTINEPGTSYGYFAYSVAGLPDINGDGRGNIAVSCYSMFDNCPVFVFDGDTGMLLYSLSSPHMGFYDDSFGYSLSGIPDADGNGFGDLVVGAEGEEPDDMADAGRAYIFHLTEPPTAVSPHQWIFYE